MSIQKYLSHQRIYKFSYLGKTTGETAEAVDNITVATDPPDVIIHTGTNNLPTDFASFQKAIK